MKLPNVIAVWVQLITFLFFDILKLSYVHHAQRTGRNMETSVIFLTNKWLPGKRPENNVGSKKQIWFALAAKMNRCNYNAHVLSCIPLLLYNKH